jgi:hypothetical protein
MRVYMGIFRGHCPVSFNFCCIIFLAASQLCVWTRWFQTVNIHAQPKGFITKNCFVSLGGLNVRVLPLRTVMAFFQNV